MDGRPQALKQHKLLGPTPTHIFETTPRSIAWRAAVAARSTFRDAVDAAYPQWLRRFFIDRGTGLSVLIEA